MAVSRFHFYVLAAKTKKKFSLESDRKLSLVETMHLSFDFHYFDCTLTRAWTGELDAASLFPALFFAPSVPPPNRAYLRTLIHNSDLEHLEKVVLDGHGYRLLHESSAIGKVTKFLATLPDFMVSKVAVAPSLS